MKKVLFGLALGLTANFAFAQTKLPDASSLAAGIPAYYTFTDSQDASVSFSAPDDLLKSFLTAVREGIDLLSWTLHSETYPAPSQRYQRLEHFGRWINDATDDTCMNTRAQVLVRDSRVDVTFRSTNHCVVESGEWLDPYAGDEMTHSKQVQIDHVVPLKNAYLTGASKWNRKARQLYANFMGVDYHLLPVNGHENMSKGDKSPDGYVPPNEGIRCSYIQHWLKIKATWKLVMTKAEAETIQKLIRESHCQEADFKMSAREVAQVRSYIQSRLNDFGD